MASHSAAVSAHGHGVATHVAHDSHGHGHGPAYREAIGNRDIVGYGWDGEPSYGDSIVWPYPAVRFREPSTEFQSAIQKEKGDWKNLSVEDKKKLYRYNYCETFSEMLAPTGVWKSITAIVIFWMTLATWAYITMKKVYGPLPETFDDEHRLAQLKRMIDLRVGAVDGLASKWDYEKGRWKE